jgi:excinuclease ABC subunit C
LSKDLKENLATLPQRPGVYLFRDEKGEVIYVGKAKSLRGRVRSYFQASPGEGRKGEQLRQEIAELEVTACKNEVEALILESTLIKKYKPRFNVILRDDKSYPYIAVTVSEEFPRVELVRGKRARGTKYYGPYVSVRAARNTLRLMRKVFPLRHCTGKEPGQKGKSPCLYYQMQMCLGPCTGVVSPEEYGRYVRLFCDFLEGKHKEVMKNLDKAMREAAAKQEYELAARLRNQIESASKVLSHHWHPSSSGVDYDLVGVYRDETQACFVVAQNRAGVYMGNLSFFTDLADYLPEGELLMEFVKRYYDQAGSIPEQILLSVSPEEEDALEEWLSSQRGGKVELRVPRRGKKLEELSLASSNAKLALEGFKISRAQDRARVDLALEELSKYLGLDKYPLRIECYDISTLGGSASVGSMVVFTEGLPDRRNYRKFSIKFTAGIDDVGMMKEVLYRRFKRYQRETEQVASGRYPSQKTGFAVKPDLILLDGGKGQLGAGLEVLKVLVIDGVEVAALAKRLEEIYRPDQREPIVLPRKSEALFLMQRIRDEAHRVAVTYHRSLMEKSTASSWLDNVAGVGEKRKRILIKHFGSPRKLEEAEFSEIEAVPSIPANVALDVFEAAKRRGEARSSDGYRNT